MDRRAFVASAIALLAALLVAGAQLVGRVARIGILVLNAPDAAASLQAFWIGMRALGWVEGQNLVIDFRSAGGKGERLSELAAELALIRNCQGPVSTRSGALVAAFVASPAPS